MLWVIMVFWPQRKIREEFLLKKKNTSSLYHYFLKGNLSRTNGKCLNELHNLSQLTGIIVS